MSKYLLKSYYWEKLAFSNFDFLSLKQIRLQVSFWGGQLTQIWLNFKNCCCNLKIWQQNCMWLFCYFNFERNYDVLRSKSSCLLLKKNMSFNKSETESKMENPPHTFRDLSLWSCFLAYRRINVSYVRSYFF